MESEWKMVKNVVKERERERAKLREREEKIWWKRRAGETIFALDSIECGHKKRAGMSDDTKKKHRQKKSRKKRSNSSSRFSLSLISFYQRGNVGIIQAFRWVYWWCVWVCVIFYLFGCDIGGMVDIDIRKKLVRCLIVAFSEEIEI